ncbi:Oidioi.mRNA.OKI2018_I69.chr2.g8406.t1.cds [Oikopleura dioica]|uniref:Oidioi.mRNA.OKI2018_I69.chr2.g8406.t1.cds n=1 Tax=Oikopleura dioica TaxID=34765 RepID=A0ABN7TC88_OIKDI|nr:Oidioi.mRNA.OKI2018_I69.chr2.g8406.t1.cds [Oikopleura dioica]
MKLSAYFLSSFLCDPIPQEENLPSSDSNKIAQSSIQRSVSLFDRLPDALMDKFADIGEYSCNNAQFHYEGPSKIAFDNRIAVKQEDIQKAFGSMFTSDLVIQYMTEITQYMSFIGYFQGHSLDYPDQWLDFLDTRADFLGNFFTEGLINALRHFPFNECKRKIVTNTTQKFINTQNAILDNDRIRAPILLVSIDKTESKSLSARTDDQEDSDEFYAVQEIVNNSNGPQTVTIEKDIVKMTAQTHTTTNSWNWGISEKYSFKAEEEFGFVKTSESVEIGINAGVSSSSTDGNSRSRTVWEKFQFTLEAPPCSKINGTISVSRETKQYDLHETFEIAGKQVTVDGTMEVRNALTQSFIVNNIEKIENCAGAEDITDHCALDAIDPLILPPGDHEWVCTTTLRKTVCKARCRNGNHYNDAPYKIYCYHESTFWYKDDIEMSPVDCS